MSTSWAPTSSRFDPEDIRRETQKDRVRDLLRSAGNDGVCSLMFYSLHLPNGRTRVGELRDDDGLAIETLHCNRNDYHRGEKVPPHMRYRWLWKAEIRQLSMFAND